MVNKDEYIVEIIFSFVSSNVLYCVCDCYFWSSGAVFENIRLFTYWNERRVFIVLRKHLCVSYFSTLCMWKQHIF